MSESKQLSPLPQLKLMKQKLNEFQTEVQVELERLQSAINDCHGRNQSIKFIEDHWNEAQVHYDKMYRQFISMYKRIDAAIDSKRKNK
jgi:acyl carrier protein phosphodiesterase